MSEKIAAGNTLEDVHCEYHTQFEYDCIDCSDALEAARREKLAQDAQGVCS